MKVKELIKELKKINPDAVVVVRDINWQNTGIHNELVSFEYYETGNTRINKFTDMQYVYWFLTGGDIPVLLLWSDETKEFF